MVGRTISHYRIEDLLGSGGMGEVFAAVDLSLKRRVAVKRLKPNLASDSEYRRRFLGEARNAARFSHPNIAAIHDIVEDCGDLFLVMEFIEGSRVGCGSNREILSFLDLAIQCCEGLAAAHNFGIVHRDIKPDNILVTSAGVIKILDFGLAREFLSAEDAQTLTGSEFEMARIAGTPSYMAPEVLLGQPAGPSSDVFSLGVVFYECLTGLHPFKAKTMVATVGRILHEEPPPISRQEPAVPAEVERTVARMLRKDPKARFSSARGVLEELKAARNRYLGIPSIGRLRRVPLRIPVLVSALSVLLVVLATFVGDSGLKWELRNLVAPARFPSPLTVLVTIGGSEQSSQSRDPMALGVVEAVTDQLRRATFHSPVNVVPFSLVREQGLVDWRRSAAFLGSNAVWIGTSVVSPDRVDFGFRLVDAEEGRPLRSIQVSSPRDAAVEASRSLIRQLVEAMEVDVSPLDRSALSNLGTESSGAWLKYLESSGHLLQSQGVSFSAAAKDLQAALSLDHEFARARALLGNALLTEYRRTGNPEMLKQSAEYCRTACDRGVAEGCVCLGEIAKDDNRLDDALGHLRLAEQLDSSNSEVVGKLADVLFRRDQSDEGRRVCDRAVIRKSGFWLSYDPLVRYLYIRCRKIDEAIEVQKKVCEMVPGSPIPYYRLGILYSELCRWQDAKGAFDQSIAVAPTGEAFLNLATSFFFQDSLGEARTAAETTIKYMADLTGREVLTAYGNLADIYWYLGERKLAGPQYESAVNQTLEFLRSNPSDGVSWSRLAWYQLQAGDQASSGASFNRALEINPNDPDILLKGAQIQHVLGHRKETLELLEASLGAGTLPEKIRTSPMFRELRGDPSFRKLVDPREQ